MLKLPILLDARFSNKFIFDDEREAGGEGNMGLFIKTRQDSAINDSAEGGLTQF